MSARRVVTALLAMMLGAAVISMLPGRPLASADPADGAQSGSAMTVSGTGEFAKLQVTVSQAKDLINQVVTVSWTGGRPTPGSNAVNFLQIMQCWGDDPAGPDRTQCQFGASQGARPDLNRRTLTSPSGVLVDPKETLRLPADSPSYLNPSVPFWPAGRDKPPDLATSSITNDFFDSQVTNEIPLARTGADGTGLVFFEVETVRQAAGLGCGDPVTTGGTVTGRKCWLVVVPRGSTEVDGTQRNRNGGSRDDDQLKSSPLSKSNWDHRIVFPLEFVPLGQACPIGVPERRVVGHELVTDAVGRWQPALCAGGGANINYTQLPDDVARGQVLDGSSPGLALVTNPIPPEQAPPGRSLVYAPVGLSALAIAFNINHRPDLFFAPPDKKQLDGQRFEAMKLTPQLVAKLLTQSYQRALVGFQQNRTPDYLKKNPPSLTEDPEFLEHNPDYKDFTIGAPQQPPDALVQLPGSDLTSLLWSWVKADPEASEFLAGKPDKYGMVVNPNNKELTLPTSTFPRNDQTCVDIDFGNGPFPWCTLDARPFTDDIHDAGRSAARGDSKGREVSLENGQPVLTKMPRLGEGLMAVVDTATATRYNLPTASLRNAAGQFVAPTTASLQAGEAAMKTSAVPGVLVSNPGATDPAAYPLTALSYAVASPSTLDAAAGKAYAGLLRFAAGPGQQPGAGPGQLPFGMVPLPADLKAKTVAAAAIIEAQAGKPPPGDPPPDQPTSPRPVSGDTAGSAGGPSAATGPSATATTPSSGTNAPSIGALAPGGSAAKAPTAIQQPAAKVGRTPALAVPAVGALLLTILICGALAATSSPVLHSQALRQVGAMVLGGLRRGVRPTKQ